MIIYLLADYLGDHTCMFYIYENISVLSFNKFGFRIILTLSFFVKSINPGLNLVKFFNGIFLSHSVFLHSITICFVSMLVKHISHNFNSWICLVLLYFIALSILKNAKHILMSGLFMGGWMGVYDSSLQ